MPEYPEYVASNRAAWTRYSPDYVEPGRRAWASDHIHWGIWHAPESEVGALGNLSQYQGLDTIELGCGTGYVSAWLAKLGARPVGIDATTAQLDTARMFQSEFNLSFPLIEASAEAVPLPDGGFDLVISEYGASIWCDPYKWIPEAARLLRPGGKLAFLLNSYLSTLCVPDEGPTKEALLRDQFGPYRMEWDGSVEFHISHGQWIRLLRENGFEVEQLIEIKPPADAEPSRYEYMTLEWANRWPSEEVWVARKRG